MGVGLSQLAGTDIGHSLLQGLFCRLLQGKVDGKDDGFPILCGIDGVGGGGEPQAVDG